MIESKRLTAAIPLHFAFTVLLGIVLGAGLYETRVLVGVWAAAPPESVWSWNEMRAAGPGASIDAGFRFWIFATPSLGLVALLLALLGRTGVARRDRLARGAALAVFVTVLVTFTYFVPGLFKFFGPDSRSIPPAELAASVNLWVMLNWVRAAILFTAFLTSLRALSIPVPEREVVVVPELRAAQVITGS